MFTGIVETIGVIDEYNRSDAGIDIVVSTGGLETSQFALGDSLAVSGVCLTITEISAHSVAVHVSNESVDRTNFGSFAPGTAVNLERPVTLAQPFGGHMVSGHVDGIAQCTGIVADGASRRIEFEVSKSELGKFIAQKGSVTIDGVSMTVNAVSDHGERSAFAVNVIPHTLSVTTLGALKIGAKVHIEVDLIARYVDRLLNCQSQADTV